MKGIILAGGSGTRLYPITKSISKQLLPVYDKPMIYYPLSILMLAGIRDILIISTEKDQADFMKLLGTGEQIGLNLCYKVQKEPNGIAEAFIIGESFINNEPVALILGDNIFYGPGLSAILKEAATLTKGACIFGYYFKNPIDYGVVEFDQEGKVISIEEKPEKPKSNFAIPGLYFYDARVCDFAKALVPSKRGELEITDLSLRYLEDESLNVKLLGRGFAWLDTGTHHSLLDAANFVEAIQSRQGYYISCIEEIAYRMGYISDTELILLAQPLLKTEYGQYLLSLVEGE